MTVEQAKEAAELIERLKNLDKALNYIKTFEKTQLPDYCRLEIGGMFCKSMIDGIPDYIAVGMIEDLRKALEAERFSVATKLEKM